MCTHTDVRRKEKQVLHNNFKFIILMRGKERKVEEERNKEEEEVFCPSLPFSTLEHHWWHVQPLKLLANRLSSFALSPCIIGVKGRCASQLMSQHPPPPLPHPLHKLPQFSGGQRRRREIIIIIFLMRASVHLHLLAVSMVGARHHGDAIRVSPLVVLREVVVCAEDKQLGARR